MDMENSLLEKIYIRENLRMMELMVMEYLITVKKQLMKDIGSMIHKKHME
jgi:hypothetical protein